MKNDIHVLILAGGSGTRLWPLSRNLFPKQFIPLKEFHDLSLFQKTYARAKQIAKKENIYVVTNETYKFHCINQSDLPEKNILIEPEQKNTLAAICFGILASQENVPWIVFPSDQIIEETLFIKTITQYIPFCEKNFLLFGITPRTPHTGYGYIHYDTTKDLPYPVIHFKEKPNKEDAKKYVQEGYLWNSGIFLFSSNIFKNLLQTYCQTYYECFFHTEKVLETFSTLPSLSIDYGLLEKAKEEVRVVPLDVYWNDLGGFDAFDELFAKENYTYSHYYHIESNDVTVLEEKENKIIATIGVEKIIIVDTPDALLISKKGETQKVKTILETLQKQHLPQTEYGMTVYRPWGKYTLIDEGKTFKVKRLTILPGKKLSYQIHYHRSEHWVVVSGTAKITIEEKEIILTRGESTYIPIGTKHQIENIGKIDLHIIESQIGEYLEEDDIVRIDDPYKRG